MLMVHLHHEVDATSRQGSGWGGWGDVKVHVHLHHEVDATSRQGLGVGWVGDVKVHVHLHHEVGATSRQGWGWGGWGDVKFFQIERKKTSVVHSHPPSQLHTYTRVLTTT